MSRKRQTFWEECYPHPVFGEMGKSGSEMFRLDDDIVLSIDDFDGEDQRTYTYSGKITIEEYREVLRKLKEVGRVEIKTPSWTWCFQLNNTDQKISIIFSGCGGSDPGGRMVYSTRLVGPIDFKQLALEEDQGKGDQNKKNSNPLNYALKDT